MSNDAWYMAKMKNGWSMPVAPWWKRLPIIRHIRAVNMMCKIEAWYAYGPGSIGISTGYDEWVAYGIWAGKEQP